jgi:hypothetical protein
VAGPRRGERGGRRGEREQVITAGVDRHAEHLWRSQRGALCRCDVQEGRRQSAMLVRDYLDSLVLGVGRRAAEEPAHAVDVLDDDREVVSKSNVQPGYDVAQMSRCLPAGIGCRGYSGEFVTRCRLRATCPDAEFASESGGLPAIRVDLRAATAPQPAPRSAVRDESLEPGDGSLGRGLDLLRSPREGGDCFTHVVVRETL